MDGHAEGTNDEALVESHGSLQVTMEWPAEATALKLIMTSVPTEDLLGPRCALATVLGLCLYHLA